MMDEKGNFVHRSRDNDHPGSGPAQDLLRLAQAENHFRKAERARIGPIQWPNWSLPFKSEWLCLHLAFALDILYPSGSA